MEKPNRTKRQQVEKGHSFQHSAELWEHSITKKDLQAKPEVPDQSWADLKRTTEKSL
jgi:hypothetical protein